MNLEQALTIITDLLSQDWEVILLICASLLLLKGVHVLNGGLYSQVANWLSSALASGLLKNVSLVNGLRFVAFSFGSALLYHLLSKVVFPNAGKLLAELRKS